VIRGSFAAESFAVLGVVLEADITEVAARQYLRLRIAIHAAALLDQANEGFALVRFAVDAPQPSLVDSLVHEDVRRNQHATHQLNCCRGECHMLAQLARAAHTT